jgi:hypothetical protein
MEYSISAGFCMSDERYKRIAEKYKKRREKESREYSINPVLQENTAKARIALSQLEDIIDRSLELINDSDHKEHIYAEAGDMIFNVSGLLEDLKESVLSLSYLSSRKEYRNIKNRLPADLREEIDTVVKHSNVAERVAERCRKSSDDDEDLEIDPNPGSYTPGGGAPEFFHKEEEQINHKDESVHNDENFTDEDEEDDMEDYANNNPELNNLFKNQDGHDSIQDWTNHDTGFIAPDNVPEIKFH